MKKLTRAQIDQAIDLLLEAARNSMLATPGEALAALHDALCRLGSRPPGLIPISPPSVWSGDTDRKRLNDFRNWRNAMNGAAWWLCSDAPRTDQALAIMRAQWDARAPTNCRIGVQRREVT